jgi:membrane-associated phospholipid phosphatase
MMAGKGLTLSTLAVALVFVLEVGGFFQGIDMTINGVILLIDNSHVRALTFLGDDPIFITVLVFVLLFDIKRKLLLNFTKAFLLSTVVGLAIVGLLKYALAVPRPRPLPCAGPFSQGAFPSGHTFRAALIASYLSSRWRKTAPLGWGLAVTVALTRFLLHYHWFSDVLFSILFAPWIYFLMMIIVGGNPNVLAD